MKFQIIFILFFLLNRSVCFSMDDRSEQPRLFIDNLKRSFDRNSLRSLCENKTSHSPNAFLVKRVLLKDFKPTFFFRNANLEGTEIVAAGTVNDYSGIYRFNLLTGKARLIDDEFETDPVPLLGLHGKDSVITFPNFSADGKGLQFYSTNKSKDHLEEKPFAEMHSVRGVYQSFGKISGNNEQTTYRFLTDTNFETSHPGDGLMTGELMVSGTGNTIKATLLNHQNICSGRLLQLPMISPDGRQIVATEYDTQKHEAETKVYDISNGGCIPKGLGFTGAKGSFSFDGKQLALSVPRHQIQDDPNLEGLKSLGPRAVGIADIMLIDLKTGKKKILTNDPSTNSIFPTFNLDGSINVYQQVLVGQKTETFFVRLDPSRQLPTETDTFGSADACVSKAIHVDANRNNLSFFVGALCDESAINDNFRLDLLTRSQCEKMISTIWKNPHFSSDLENLHFKMNFDAKGMAENRLSKSDMLEFCRMKK